MFSTFFNFEIKNWVRSPMPWIFLLLFGLLQLGATVSDNITIGGGGANIWKNAALGIQFSYGIWSLIGLLLVAAFLNGSILRDFENHTDQIVFASPINKAGYYFGHYFGGFAIAIIPIFGIALGYIFGTFLNGIFEWTQLERYGPNNFLAHFNGLMVFTLPNLLFAGGICYAVAAVTRSTAYPFVAVLLLMVGYIISGTFLQDIDNETIARLADPFGIRTFSIATKYWTVDQQNNMSLGLFDDKWVLINRLIWSGVGIASLLFGYKRFTFEEKARSGGKKNSKSSPAPIPSQSINTTSPIIPLPRVTLGIGIATRWSQLWSQFKTDFKSSAKSTPFLLISLIGLLNLWGGMSGATDGYGTKELPATTKMVDYVRGSFYLFLMMIQVYFCGVLVWKERNAKTNEIIDAMPTRNWTMWLGKYLAITSLMAILLSLAIVAAVFTQSYYGYDRHEIGMFVGEILVRDLIGLSFWTAIFFLIHALSRNMYLGFFIGVLLFVGHSFLWQGLKISSNLVKLGGTPSYKVSDFFGIAPYAKDLSWFNSYWSLFGGIIALVTILFWPRGKETWWKKRIAIASNEWKTYKVFGMGIISIWAAIAGFLFYNTQVLNKYDGETRSEKLRVEYEQFYKKYEDIAQPRIVDVKYNIQLFPESRTMLAHVDWVVRNKSTVAIDSMHLTTSSTGKMRFENPRLTLLLNDSVRNYRIYRISPALAPGDSMTVSFDNNFIPKGVENEVTFVKMTQNGTFFNNGDFTPVIGYVESSEMSSKNDRKKYGLPEKTRAPAFNPQDTVARMKAYIGADADWVNVETTISTSTDQIAIAPGSLVKEWTEGNRRYFNYKFDYKGWNFYSFMSARYEVARQEWNGIKLEVYYHKDHAYNVDRMMNSMRKSLEYYIKNFGPYYHKQARIIEFPRIASFAQAFPGTMPYSEEIGFMQDLPEEEDDLDKVFYVVAHEMGHQYWAHQACGAAMQGSEMTTETFAQYSALMVMEHEYGRDQMRKFLTYEMDGYLRARGREQLRELPLAKCENQGYIHYQKGSVVMYYLKEMIGEERVNTALSDYLKRFRYMEPPFPTSADPIAEFEKQTPDSLRYIIKDLFWDITLFDNRTTEVSVRNLPNGKFEVTIKTESRKLKADDLGKENEVPVADWMEIGAFAKPESGKRFGKTLYRQRVHVTQLSNTFTFVVDEKPDKAGIDPFKLLIERNPEDNLKEF